MKKIILIIAAVIFVFAGCSIQDRIVVEITINSDDSPLINDIYSIGQLKVIEGDVAESLFDGSKILILEELPGESEYSLEMPDMEVGNQIYRVELKNEFITNDSRIKHSDYDGYFWFFDAEEEGGYPILKFDIVE